MEQLQGAGDLHQPGGVAGLAGLQGGGLACRVEVGRHLANRLQGAAPVGVMQHPVLVEAVLVGPLQPMALDAVPGIHQDAVQVENDRIAVKLE